MQGLQTTWWMPWKSRLFASHPDFAQCLSQTSTKMSKSWTNWEVQSEVSHWSSYSHEVRREEVVLSRACIGHSHLIHDFLLRKEDQSQCLSCCPVKYIFSNCVEFILTRQKYFLCGGISEQDWVSPLPLNYADENLRYRASAWPAWPQRPANQQRPWTLIMI